MIILMKDNGHSGRNRLSFPEQRKTPETIDFYWVFGGYIRVARGGLELKFSCKKNSKIKEFYNAVILKVIKSHQKRGKY